MISSFGRNPPSVAAAAVILCAIAVFFTDLGDTSLPSQDDAYQAQVTKEMMDRGDFIGITYGGYYSFQNSPLPNWLMALSYMVFGVNEYAARFPSAALALIGILAVYCFARTRWGEASAVISAFILLTTSLYLRYGRHAMADLPLAVFSTFALIFLIQAQKNRRLYLLFGLFAGLAILTKSALGLIPVIVAFCYLVLTGQGRSMLNRWFFLGLLVMIGVSCVWYITAIFIYGDVFLQSHFGAYLATHVTGGHQQSLGIWGFLHYFIWIPIQFMPWTLALLPVLIWAFRSWKKDEAVPVLWLATILPVLLLSLITTKYTRYLILIFPPAALLIAAVLHSRIRGSWWQKAAKAIGWTSLAAALVIVIFPVPLAWDRNDDIRDLSPVILTLATDGQELINFRLSHFKYQNPLLFYTDHTFSNRINDPAEAMAEITLGEHRLGLTRIADYADIIRVAPEGVYVQEEAVAGELVLFSITTPTIKDWKAELSQFTALIHEIEPSGYVGSYHIPRDDIYKLLRDDEGIRIMPTIDKPRRLFRTMERRGTKTGLAWRTRKNDLVDVMNTDYRTTFLAYSTHLVLFRIEKNTLESE